MKTCTVIYNPYSGHNSNDSNISKYKELIEKYNYKVTVYKTEYHGHAKEIIAHLKKCDLVMSFGGDGTFNEVVYGNILRKEKLVLCHIPVGTTNDIGAMFGYTKDTLKNIKLALEGEIKSIDIPLINGRPFVYVSGFGKFMNIPYDTARKEKKTFGYLAYIKNSIKEFFNKTEKYSLEYEIDGIKYSGIYSFMLIANATRIAGVNNFFNDVKLNDDKFEVLLCTYTDKKDILAAFAKLVVSDAEHVDGFEYKKISNIKIKFDKYPKNAWCIDGEKLEIRTKTYEIHNLNDFKILIPKKNIKKLFN